MLPNEAHWYQNVKGLVTSIPKFILGILNYDILKMLLTVSILEEPHASMILLCQ